jgi:hypothetical protein
MMSNDGDATVCDATVCDATATANGDPASPRIKHEIRKAKYFKLQLKLDFYNLICL